MPSTVFYLLCLSESSPQSYEPATIVILILQTVINLDAKVYYATL